MPKPSLGHNGVPKDNLGTRIKKALVAQAFQPVLARAFACCYRKMVGRAHPTCSNGA
jgi:hypothetical protein